MNIYNFFFDNFLLNLFEIIISYNQLRQIKEILYFLNLNKILFS